MGRLREILGLVASVLVLEVLLVVSNVEEARCDLMCDVRVFALVTSRKTPLILSPSTIRLTDTSS